MKEDEYKPIPEKYIGGAGARSNEGIYQTPDEVTDIVVQCVKNPVPPIRTRTSTWSKHFCNLKTSTDPEGKKLQKEVIDKFL